MVRKSYSREFRERAVGLVFGQVSDHESQWDVIVSVASKVWQAALTKAGRAGTARRCGPVERGQKV